MPIILKWGIPTVLCAVILAFLGIGIYKNYKK